MIYNINQRKYLARHPRWAVGWFERLRGMIGRRFVDGELDAMVFERCGMVHSCWMSIGGWWRYDVIFDRGAGPSAVGVRLLWWSFLRG